MKISTPPVEVGQITSGVQSGQRAEVAPALSSEVSPKLQAELLLDSQVKMLLAEVTKFIARADKTISELPPQTQEAVREQLEPPLAADSLLSQGLTATVKGPKLTSEGLVSLSRVLTDAITVQEQFPEGQPQELHTLLAKLSVQFNRPATEMTAEFMKLISQLANSQETTALLTLQGACQQLLAEMMPQPKSSEQAPPKYADLNSVLAKIISLFGEKLTDAVPPTRQEIYSSLLKEISQQLSAEGQNGKEVGKQFTSSLPSLVNELLDRFTARMEAEYLSQGQQNPQESLRSLSRAVLPDNLSAAERDVLSKFTSKLVNLADNASQALELYQLPQAKESFVAIKLAAVRQWLKLDTPTLQSTVRGLATITSAFQQTVETSGEAAPTHHSLTMALPLYIGEPGKLYPTYIHVFQEEDESGTSGLLTRETWLRLCLGTENIGVVDMIFHLHDSKQLSVRLAFSDPSIAASFKGFLPEIKEMLDQSPLKLNDFVIRPK